jgi:hypothetical protein
MDHRVRHFPAAGVSLTSLRHGARSGGRLPEAAG